MAMTIYEKRELIQHYNTKRADITELCNYLYEISGIANLTADESYKPENHLTPVKLKALQASNALGLASASLSSFINEIQNTPALGEPK